MTYRYRCALFLVCWILFLAVHAWIARSGDDGRLESLALAQIASNETAATELIDAQKDRAQLLSIGPPVGVLLLLVIVAFGSMVVIGRKGFPKTNRPMHLSSHAKNCRSTAHI